MRQWKGVLGGPALVVIALVVMALMATGCSTAADTSPAQDTGGAITVFAASSLTEAFREIGAAYEADHPGERVSFSFGASGTLATQLGEGAPADVVATADRATMQRLLDKGVVATPVVFATNELAIVVEPGNPHHVASLADLAGHGLLIVLAADGVPAGDYSRLVLQRAGVTVQPVSLEANVKGVLAKVVAGEADAGLVYRSDVVTAAGAVDGVAIPTASNVVADYPAAALTDAADPDGAARFVAYLGGEDARAILLAHGFGRP